RRPTAPRPRLSRRRALAPVRGLLPSPPLAALAGLPFFLLFCAVFWYIAGGLVWIPLAALVAMVLPGVLAQKRLRALAQENMRESSLRSAMLVESGQGIEDIQQLPAESRFQNHWNPYHAVNAA